MWLVWTLKKIDKLFFESRETTRISRYNIKPVDKGITDQTHILEHNKEFYETLQKPGTKKNKKTIEMEKIFSNNNIPKLWKSSRTVWGRFNGKRFIQFSEK